MSVDAWHCFYVGGWLPYHQQRFASQTCRPFHLCALHDGRVVFAVGGLGISDHLMMESWTLPLV